MDYIVTYEQAQQLPNPMWVDLRTPDEFLKAHILGAVSLPILSNEQFHDIGYLYKQVSYEEAKIRAVQYVNAILPQLFASLVKESHDYSLILYCDRGGYRSSVLFKLLRALDIHVFKLDGGYKSYRAFVRHELKRLLPSFKYICLSGYTGSGKTELLKELARRGANVLDLEALANHRGSLLGQVGLGSQPSQKQFETLIFNEFQQFIPNKPVFIENESVRIGHLEVPALLKKAYDESPHQVLITAPLEERVQRLQNEYVTSESSKSEEEIIQALNLLKRYLSKDKVQKLIEEIKRGAYAQVIEDLIVNYYDPTYKIVHSDFSLIVDYHKGDTTCETLLSYAEHI